jgi:hypothetical protein
VWVDRSDRRYIVAILAQELDISADEVDGAYQRELERLGSEARIQNFVPLLAARKVRAALKRKPSTLPDRRPQNAVIPSRAPQKTHDRQGESGAEHRTAYPLRQGAALFNARLEAADLERVFLMSERRRANDEPEPNQDEHGSGDGEFAHAASVS